MTRLRDALELEWKAIACRPEASRRVRQWAADEPMLVGFEGPDDIVGVVRQPTSARAANDLLGALVRRSVEDDLARRCLLQALMPAFMKLAQRHQSTDEDFDDRLQGVLVLAIERIHELAGVDLAWPSNAIVGHVRDRLRQATRRAWIAPRQVCLDEARELAAGPERSTSEYLAQAVLEGLRQGALRHQDAALIYTTRVVGCSMPSLAEAQGLDVRAIRTRLRRAERRLADASISVC